MTKQEVIDRLKNSKTWREAGVTTQEVLSVLVREENHTDNSETVEEYKKTIENLRSSVRKLRSEVKRLKGSKE